RKRTHERRLDWRPDSESHVRQVYGNAESDSFEIGLLQRPVVQEAIAPAVAMGVDVSGFVDVAAAGHERTFEWGARPILDVDANRTAPRQRTHDRSVAVRQVERDRAIRVVDLRPAAVAFSPSPRV